MAASQILRGIAGVVGPAVLSLLASLVAWKLAAWLAGPNISDVGVTMHARGNLAIAGGLAIYVAVVLGGLVLLVYELKAPPALVWGAGGAVGGSIFLALAALLWITYA